MIKNNTKSCLLLLSFFFMTNLSTFGLVGGGSLTLVNNTRYDIYLRQVPIVAIWAFLMDTTDPVEFSYSNPLPPHSTSLPASWSIFSVGNKSTTSLDPSMVCCLGFVTNEDRIEVNINLAINLQVVTIGDCSFDVETELSDFGWTWPSPNLFYDSYGKVKLTVSENGRCGWKN